MRVHPFPSRTRKLSSLAPKILGGQLPGKIGRCQHKGRHREICVFSFHYLKDGNGFHPLSCGTQNRFNVSVDTNDFDRCANSFFASSSTGGARTNCILNTEVKLISVEDTWRAAARENRTVPTQRKTHRAICVFFFVSKPKAWYVIAIRRM